MDSFMRPYGELAKLTIVTDAEEASLIDDFRRAGSFDAAQCS